MLNINWKQHIKVSLKAVLLCMISFSKITELLRGQEPIVYCIGKHFMFSYTRD